MVPPLQEGKYFKNLLSIEQKIPQQGAKEIFLYQKAPHLITKSHKNSI
jgi:hypothetical protein